MTVSVRKETAPSSRESANHRFLSCRVHLGRQKKQGPARLGPGIDGLVRWWRLAIRALCDKNRVWRRAESVNCDWIVCRIGVGLEKSPGLRSRTRSSQKESLRTPRVHGRGFALSSQRNGLAREQCTGPLS
jgi:hypothetical protein